MRVCIHGISYKQTYELVCNGLLCHAPIIANLNIEHFEARSSYPNTPECWFRYMDWTHYPNCMSMDPCIKFTMEPASDGKLPFLDTCTYQEWTTHQSCHIWHTWHSSVSGVWLQPSSESQKIGRLIILITKAPFVTTATKRGSAKLYSG